MNHIDWFPRKLGIISLVLLVITWGGVLAQAPKDVLSADSLGAPAPAPPTNVRVIDKPNDAGHGLIIRWDLSADDTSGLKNVDRYEVLRSDAPDGEFISRGIVFRGVNEYEDVDDMKPTASSPNPNYMAEGSTWFYKVVALSNQQVYSEPSEIVVGTTRENLFHWGKLPILIAVIIFTAYLLNFIISAKKGKKLYIRPLAGIDAVDDAIGRATEMGKPILFILGLGTAADIATIAGFTILSRVAKKTAEYQTRVLVPVQDPVVLAVAQETVRTAYLEAGRPDQYNSDNIFYVTAMQFPYVAAVNSIMLREKPATNFYMGLFYAESLLLAETGNIAGSIQISGTDQIAQLPFFVAATDFTLIGEELYAASAYLSQEPVQLGTLKAQDYTKAIIMIIIILGAIAITGKWTFIRDIITIHL
ncbi:MAG: hypothetical protein B6D58_06590 [candidate division Zixibacteria bacterium 4484_95]|nr:MAG: hypothetical protein B6D58_06590 [candidate division Zixibacteria bacterium 4484_95]RKX21148.1 MAG: hypothetical protein DRP26_00250 [candidate division Zixibacteria bacterium]